MRKMQNRSALSAIEVTELMLNFKVIKKLVLEQVKCDECGKEICDSFILKRQKATVHGIKPKDVNIVPCFLVTVQHWTNTLHQTSSN